jgi:hypothetical protein
MENGEISKLIDSCVFSEAMMNDSMIVDFIRKVVNGSIYDMF